MLATKNRWKFLGDDADMRNKKFGGANARHSSTISRHRHPLLSDSSRQVEKPKVKLDFGWVSLFSMSITVFVAVAFGAGKAYRDNYLTAFKFTDTALPWQFQDVVYLGVTKQLPILLAAPVVALGAIAGFLILVGSLLMLGDRLAARRLRKATMPSQRINKGKSGMESLLDVSQFLVNSLGSVLLFSLLALFFVARAEKLGGADAKSAIASIAKSAVNKSNLSYVTIERMIGGQRTADEGYLVSCSARACGLYSPGKGKDASRLIPLDNVLSFRFRD